MAEEKTWLEAINEKADLVSKELSTLFGQTVKPFVFVIDEEAKDAAIGYFRTPDAKQAFKILRSMGEDYEVGIELIARAQLIRQADVNARGVEGESSDMRFMDVDGKYSPEHSEINLSLLMKASTLIRPFSDQFKKK